MLAIYYVGACFIFNVMLLCQGYPKTNMDTGALAFQESEEENVAVQNAKQKKPVHFPSRCKDGELYYPGDQQDDWVCDCKPGFIYYPTEAQCYEAHRKGPCLERQILVLRRNEVIPKCVPNPCELNHVWFSGKCYELEKPGPCPFPDYPNVVSVNKTTLDIICTQGTVRDYFPVTSSITTTTTTTTTTSTESAINLDDRFGITKPDVIGPPKPDPELRYDENDCLVGGYRWTHGLCQESPIENETKCQ